MSSVTTRSGRVVRKPERYEPPVEKLLDDYSDDEYEDIEDDDDDCDSIRSEDEDEDEEEDEDEDENGNLKGFVESDDESEEDED